MRLRSPDGRTDVEVDPAAGARLRSLRRDGVELLHQSPRGDPMLTACYPMAPWAGRVRRGEFGWNGEVIKLPVTAPPHAIHGIVHDVAWVGEADALAVSLDTRWPFGGSASQSISVHDAAVVCRLTVTAGAVAMPVALGYHPCFQRRLADGGELMVQFEPGWMWRRDADGIATAERVPPPDGRWDDAFGGVATGPRLRWSNGLELEIRSTHDVWVVYDELPEVVCVEPQTAPPDAFNLGGNDAAATLAPGESLTLEMGLRWVEATSC